jgi:hypothetical protein
MARYEGLNDWGTWDRDGSFYPPKNGPYAGPLMKVIENPDVKQAKSKSPAPRQLTEMTPKEIGQLSMQEYAKLRSQKYEDAERRALLRRENAFAGLQDTRRRTPIAPYDHPKTEVIRTGFGDVEMECDPWATRIEKWRWCREKFIETGEQRYQEALLTFVEEGMVGFDDDYEKAPVLAVQPAGRVRLAVSRVRALGRRLLAWLRH